MFVVGPVISKDVAMLSLLEHGSVITAFNADYDGVNMPSHFTGDIALRWGYDLSPPIPDLKISDYAVEGTLQFNGIPYRVTIPWGAIFAMRAEGTDHSITWSREVEVEIGVEAEPPAKPRHLKLVD